MSAFGLIGLVFGPVVVAIASALLSAYLRPVSASPRRAEGADDPPRT
jgi:predicted PurR-regulated permease PerM